MTNYDMLETIDVLIADDAMANTVKTEFSDYPGEKPNKAQLKVWVESWKNDLNKTGFGALMRG